MNEAQRQATRNGRECRLKQASSGPLTGSQAATGLPAPPNPADYPPPSVVEAPEAYDYDADAPADEKFRRLGRRLAAVGDLFRHADPQSGLWQVVRGRGRVKSPCARRPTCRPSSWAGCGSG
jgi:hypothetical protein